MRYFLTLFLIGSFVYNSFSQGLWTREAPYPSGSYYSATFATRSIGYVYTNAATHNFYAYDPSSNMWSAKADFPGGARQNAVVFATDSFGYLGAGQLSGQAQNDFYRYNPGTDMWDTVASCPDSLYMSFGFAINNMGYIFGGTRDSIGYLTLMDGGFSYDEASNTWTSLGPIPHIGSAGFSAVVSGKGYCAYSGGDSIYQYSPSSDSWLAVDSMPVISSYSGSGPYTFAINNKIYIYDLHALGTLSGMRVYDVLANTWTTINAFPDLAPYSQCSVYPFAAFGLANKGYLGVNNCFGNNFWQFDTAYYFSISAVAPDTICQQDSFSISFGSNLPFSGTNIFSVQVTLLNQSYTTVISDSVQSSSTGTYTFSLPNSSLPGNVNAATVSIHSTSPAQQTGYAPTFLYLKKKPVHTPIPADYWSCGGSAVLLYRPTSAQEHTSWTSDPAGVNDTLFSLSFTPTQQTTIYNQTVYTATGCSVTDSTVIHFNTPPSLNISDSSFALCPGASATLGGPAIPNCSYSWTSAGYSSAMVNPVLMPSVNSVYSVFIKDTTTFCSTSGHTTVTIKQPPAQTICFVTVDSSSTHNIIIWEKADKYATDSFHLYRETSTNNYSLIATVSRDDLSEYHDYDADPNVTAYRYKITATDTCTNMSALSPYHNTIHLQYLGGGNLIWNVYEIENDSVTPVSSFDIYRDSLANGNWQIMLNVPGNQYTATDIDYTMHPNARYRVVANWSYSCTPTRSANSVLSNIIQLAPTGIITLEQVNDISLYPNPAKNEIVISTRYQVDEVSMLSADGKLAINAIHPDHNKIDISQLAEGVYIAEIKVNGIVQRIKWVKM